MAKPTLSEKEAALIAAARKEFLASKSGGEAAPRPARSMPEPPKPKARIPEPRIAGPQLADSRLPDPPISAPQVKRAHAPMAVPGRTTPAPAEANTPLDPTTVAQRWAALMASERSQIAHKRAQARRLVIRSLIALLAVLGCVVWYFIRRFP